MPDGMDLLCSRNLPCIPILEANSTSEALTCRRQVAPAKGVYLQSSTLIRNDGVETAFVGLLRG